MTAVDPDPQPVDDDDVVAAILAIADEMRIRTRIEQGFPPDLPPVTY